MDETDCIKKGVPQYACSHRTRPVSESLTEFRAMRDGKYRARQAALRMKQDLIRPNPQMWGIFAYPVVENDEGSFCQHMCIGDKWRIYPTYDSAHCLCDSLEGITHSLCIMEFGTARGSYEWLCDELGVSRPMQREYALICQSAKSDKPAEGTAFKKPKAYVCFLLPSALNIEPV